MSPEPRFMGSAYRHPCGCTDQISWTFTRNGASLPVIILLTSSAMYRTFVLWGRSESEDLTITPVLLKLYALASKTNRWSPCNHCVIGFQFFIWQSKHELVEWFASLFTLRQRRYDHKEAYKFDDNFCRTFLLVKSTGCTCEKTYKPCKYRVSGSMQMCDFRGKNASKALKALTTIM